LIYYKEEGLNCCAGRYSIVLNSIWIVKYFIIIIWNSSFNQI
jgi:hypothetical protein